VAQNVVGGIIAIGILLMLGVLIVGNFQAQTEANKTPLTEPASDVLAAPFDYDTAYSLTYSPILEDSEVVEQGGTTFTRDTDYTIDYTAGTITILSTGSISNQTDVNISYRYFGTTWNTYSNVKTSIWGSLNLMGMYPWVLGAVAILGVVALIGRRR